MILLSGLSAVLYGRKAEETLPPVLFSMMLLTYLSGILGIISHIPEILFLAVLAGALLLSALILRQYSRERGLSLFSGEGLKTLCREFISALFTPGMAVLVILSVSAVFLCRHMLVLNWDDLNYWATFSRDMYAIQGVPAGTISSSAFRDYHPIVQYLYYVGFRIIGRFSEHLMFSVNQLLILIGLTPFFHKKEGEKLYSFGIRAAFGAVFPFLCMRQMLYCLGVDCIMTSLFGYGLYMVFERMNGREGLHGNAGAGNADRSGDFSDISFYYGRIAAVSSVLVLTKNTGVFPAAVIILLFLISELPFPLSGKRKTVSAFAAVITSVLPFLFLLSWRLFCIRRGNTSYLGDRLSGNLKGTRVTGIPSYALKVCLKFWKQFFVFHLNGGPLGMSAGGILVLFLLIVFGSLYLKKRSLKSRESGRDRTVPEGRRASGKKALALGILLAGFAAYLSMLLYTYLFIFDEWEALDLSSYDRYITVYAGALLYLALYVLTREAFSGLSGRKQYLIPAAVLCLSIISISFGTLYENWNSSVFYEKNRESIALKEVCEREYASWDGKNAALGERILIADGKTDNGRRQFSRYAAVPAVVSFYSFSEGGEEAAEEFFRRCEKDRITWIYFPRNVSLTEEPAFQELSLREGGTPVQGKLYRPEELQIRAD